ncbi:MAG: hypothetical protein Q4C18_02745, partial [Eubacteriales bacterium]|nr:hypothetical protein [Eubacteriales bacterium]
MGEIINFDNSRNDMNENPEIMGLEALTDSEILDVSTAINRDKALRIPIAELSTLGAGVSSLIPAFHTVTQEINMDTTGKNLWRIPNLEDGDKLSKAKKYPGMHWAFVKNSTTGKSEHALLEEVTSLSGTSQTVAAIDPATMLMAAALYTIEKELAQIEETQKKILTFLELERESELKANVASLLDIVSNYKYRWDNEQQVASNHNQIA